MAKFTFVVGLIFIVNTLTLGYFYNKEKKVSIAEDIKVQKSEVPETPKLPTVPKAPKTD